MNKANQTAVDPQKQLVLKSSALANAVFRDPKSIDLEGQFISNLTCYRIMELAFSQYSMHQKYGMSFSRTGFSLAFGKRIGKETLGAACRDLVGQSSIQIPLDGNRKGFEVVAVFDTVRYDESTDVVTLNLSNGIRKHIPRLKSLQATNEAVFYPIIESTAGTSSPRVGVLLTLLLNSAHLGYFEVDWLDLSNQLSLGDSYRKTYGDFRRLIEDTLKKINGAGLLEVEEKVHIVGKLGRQAKRIRININADNREIDHALLLTDKQIMEPLGSDGNRELSRQELKALLGQHKFNVKMAGVKLGYDVKTNAKIANVWNSFFNAMEVRARQAGTTLSRYITSNLTYTIDKSQKRASEIERGGTDAQPITSGYLVSCLQHDYGGDLRDDTGVPIDVDDFKVLDDDSAGDAVEILEKEPEPTRQSGVKNTFRRQLEKETREKATTEVVEQFVAQLSAVEKRLIKKLILKETGGQLKEATDDLTSIQIRHYVIECIDDFDERIEERYAAWKTEE